MYSIEPDVTTVASVVDASAQVQVAVAHFFDLEDAPERVVDSDLISLSAPPSLTRISDVFRANDSGGGAGGGQSRVLEQSLDGRSGQVRTRQWATTLPYVLLMRYEARDY